MKYSFAANLLVRINPISFTLIATLFLSPLDLGTLVVYFLITTLLVSILPLGFDGLIVRQGSTQRSKIGEYLKIQLMSTLVFTIGLLALSLVFTNVMQLPVTTVVMFAVLNSMSSSLLLALVAEGKYKQQLLSVLAGLLLQYLYLALNPGTQTLSTFLESQFFLPVTTILINHKILMHAFKSDLRWQNLASKSKLVGPLLLNGISLWFVSFFERLVLEGYWGSEKLASYHLTALLAAGPILIFELTQNLQIKRLAQLPNQKVNNHVNETFRISSYLYVAMIAIIVSSLCLLSSLETPLLGGLIDLPILSTIFIVGFFKLSYLSGSAELFYHLKTKQILLATLFSATTIITASFTVVPIYGSQGAAWSTLAAIVVQSIGVSPILFRVDKSRWQFAANLTLGLLMLLLSVSVLGALTGWAAWIALLISLSLSIFLAVKYGKILSGVK